MATVDLGKIRVHWRGAYSSSTTYEHNDGVTYNNSSYAYINNTATAGTTPTTTTHWQIIAQGVATMTTRGDMVFYGASGNERLSAGTSGQYLQTKGASADPVWAEGSLPSQQPYRGVLKYTYTSSLVPQVWPGTIDPASYTNSTGIFTKTAHGLIDGQRIRFVGSSNITAGSIFELDYTYYVRDSDANSFKLCKTFVYHESAPTVGTQLTGGTDINVTVTNMYRQRLLSDNWMGFDTDCWALGTEASGLRKIVEGTTVSEIEFGLSTNYKLGGMMHAVGMRHVNRFTYIDSSYTIWSSGRQGYPGDGIYNESDSQASGGWSPAIYPLSGGLRAGEKFVQIIDLGWRSWCARTNMGGLFSCGMGNHGSLGHGNTASQRMLKRIQYFDENDLFVLGVACSPAQYSDSGDGYPNTFVVCAKRGAGTTEGIPNYEWRGLYAHGHNQTHGSLGIGSLTDAHTPTRVSNLTAQVQQLTCGSGMYASKMVMATTDDTSRAQADGNKTVWTWGGNEHGFGDGTLSKFETSPGNYGLNFDDAHDACWIINYGSDRDRANGDGTMINFFLTSTGKAYMCGVNNNGQGGVGNATDVSTWAHSGGSIRFREIWCNERTTFGLEGVPGTGHHGQTWGTWGLPSTYKACGRNGIYRVYSSNNTENITTFQEQPNQLSEFTYDVDGDAVLFPKDQIVHIPLNHEHDPCTMVLDANGNIWVWGDDDNYDYHYGASGTTLQYPNMVCKNFGQVTQYEDGVHNLCGKGLYPAIVKGFAPHQSRAIIVVQDNNGAIYAQGANYDELNAKGMQGDTRGLSLYTNDVT